MDRTLDRLAPLTGPLFAVLSLFAVLGLGGSTPDTDAKASKVVAYYTDHHGRQSAAALVLALGGLALVFFAGSLRQAFAGPERGAERRTTIVFAGAIVAAVGLLGMAASHFALADSIKDLSPDAAQALNALDGSTWMITMAGMDALMFSAGLVAVTTRRVVPVWMGWVAIALAVIGVTPLGWIALGLSMIWLGVVGIVLWRRQAAPAPMDAPMPAAPAAAV